MIQVSAVDTVLGKLQDGQNWVTITGNAGDGKKTLGYQALQKLQIEEVKVYHIEEPEEYNALSGIDEKRVILFVNCFGDFTSDRVLINKWKDVLSKITRQLQQDEQMTQVIFVSRKNVLNESKEYLNHLQRTIMNPDCVVDLSAVIVESDRRGILDHYLNKKKLKIRSEVKEMVVKMTIAHGFPNCCNIFSSLRPQNAIDIVDFFTSPLKFLDMTTTHLYYGNCKHLFELLVKNTGSFQTKTIIDKRERRTLLKRVREQDGSYIRVSENGVCKFAHQAIYESVLNVICLTNPLFCVKHATLPVLRQKINLVSEEVHKSPAQINVKPVQEVVKALASRFQPEIRNDDFTILAHKFCENKDFTSELLDLCFGSDNQDHKLDARDKDGRTMFMAAVLGGRKPMIGALIDHGADVNPTDESGNTPLLYFCQQDKVDYEVIKLLVKSSGLKCNMINERGMTAVHYLCASKNFQMDVTQHVLREGGGDINQEDEFGTTPLHWLARNENASVEDIKQLIVDGRGDIHKIDDFCQATSYFLHKRNVILETLEANQADRNLNTGVKSKDVCERSFEDLVFKLHDGKFSICVIGPAMTLSSDKVHARLKIEDVGKEMTNLGRSGERPFQFHKLCGTSSSFLTFPNISPLFAAYWETNSCFEWQEGKGRVATPLEMGVVEGLEHLDKEVFVSRLPGSVSLCVEGDCPRHIGHLCVQVWKRGHLYAAEQIGDCITMATPQHGTDYNFKFGLVLAVARGRVAFIDFHKGTLLCKINHTFSKEVYPMFGVNPINDQCATKMRLVSGREISITDEKKELIRQALFD